MPGQAPPSKRLVAVADRLHSAAIHLLRRLRGEDEGSGLSAPRLSALSVIVYAGPITMGELAAAEQVRPATISRLVKDLDSEGLVRRSADPADERIQRVHATAKGRRLLEEGRRRRVTRLASDLAELPPTVLARLERTLEVLETLARGSRPGSSRGRRG